jgi:transaldolase
MTANASALGVKIFADGADKQKIAELAALPVVQGFTTNPSLMKQAGVTDYEAFAKEILPVVAGRSISFEVFADEFPEMERQALKIADWGDNVYVKIPVTNTKGESTTSLIRRLVARRVKLNVTAIFTSRQIREVVDALAGATAAYVSVFAGRIADAGIDPMPAMREAVELCDRSGKGLEVIWASPRELLNIVQANSIGCHIITVTPDMLKKLSTLGKDLGEFSLDTVKTFYKDGLAAGYKL